MKCFLASILIFSHSLMAADYKAASCNDSDFTRGAWQDLSSQEELLARHLRDIGDHSGDTGEIVHLTNCRVKWPVDEKGYSIDGLRTVVMDKVWKKNNRTYHAGMKILYSIVTNSKYQPDGAVCSRKARIIRGFSFCRTPLACEELGIPLAVTPEKPSELPPPTDLPVKPIAPPPPSEPTPDHGPLEVRS